MYSLQTHYPHPLLTDKVAFFFKVNILSNEVRTVITIYISSNIHIKHSKKKKQTDKGLLL